MGVTDLRWRHGDNDLRFGVEGPTKLWPVVLLTASRRRSLPFGWE